MPVVATPVVSGVAIAFLCDQQATALVKYTHLRSHLILKT